MHANYEFRSLPTFYSYHESYNGRINLKGMSLTVQEIKEIQTHNPVMGCQQHNSIYCLAQQSQAIRSHIWEEILCHGIYGSMTWHDMTVIDNFKLKLFYQDDHQNSLTGKNIIEWISYNFAQMSNVAVISVVWVCHFMINVENSTPGKLQQILNFCGSLF